MAKLERVRTAFRHEEPDRGPVFDLLFNDVANICDLFHESDMWAVFHSDGNLWEIMDQLVEAGIDGINPNEPESGM